MFVFLHKHKCGFFKNKKNILLLLLFFFFKLAEQLHTQSFHTPPGMEVPPEVHVALGESLFSVLIHLNLG